MISKYAVIAVLQKEHSKWKREINGSEDFCNGYKTGLAFAISVVNKINKDYAERILNNPRYSHKRNIQGYLNGAKPRHMRPETKKGDL